MNTKTPIITVLLLSLSLLMLSPSAYNPRVHAASANFQTTETNWSPIGPRFDNLLITEYSDFLTMFANFNTGQMDMTDWPLAPAQVTQFQNNPDVYITAKQTEFGIFQLDINHRAPIFGIAQQAPRTKVAATFTTTSGTAACGSGFGTVTVTLINRENGSSTVKDIYNKVTLQEFPLGAPVQGPVTDSTASGTYTFSCVNAEPSYTISASEYNTTTATATTSGGATTFLAQVALASQASVAVTLTVSYNSPSTVSETQNGVYARYALAHMLDKPNFVASDPALGGRGVCDDVQGPPGYQLTGAACIPGQSPFGSTIGNSCAGTTLPVAPPQNTELPNSNPTAGNCFNPALLASIESGLLSTAPTETGQDGGNWTSTVTSSNSYISAYNIGPTSVIGAASRWWNTQGIATAGYASPNNLRAACDYLTLAGLTLTPSGSTCKQLAIQSESTTAPTAANYIHFVPAAGASNSIIMYIRTSLARKHFGQVFADTINMLFGTANGIAVSNGGTAYCAVNYGFKSPAPIVGQACAPFYYVIREVVPIVFEDQKTTPWNAYTGGFSLGTTPDSLWSQFHSQFASSTCGGPFSSFPSNDDYNCSPQFDAYSNAGEFSPTLGTAQPIFNQTSAVFMKFENTVPVYSVIDQFAELNCMNWQPGPQSSIVRTNGHGTEIAFWTLFNAQFNPDYKPVNAATYTCGGNGAPETLRRGFSQDTDNMNPYQALTVWDFEIISQVFDSMLAVNPITAGATQQVFDWMTQSHVDSSSASEISCVGLPSLSPTLCATGVLTQKWVLRHDLFFADGTQVNAYDICYSILSARDSVGALLYSSAFNVASCVPQTGTGTATNPDTVVVKIQGGGAFSDINIGGLPIIPAHGPHSWAGTGTCTYPNTDCLTYTDTGPGTALSHCGGALVQTTIVGPDGQPHPYTFIPDGDIGNCANPAYDPMAGGAMVGSGPWVCATLPTSTTPNVVGGPCTSSGTSVLASGNTALLRANHLYMRGPPDLTGGKLQTGLWADKFSVGAVNILDIADASLHFGASDPYWGNPSYTCGGGTVVDICAVGTAATNFGAGLDPSGLGGLTLLDMSGTGFSIGGTSDANVQQGSSTCASFACISVQQVSGSGSTVQLRVSYTGTTAKTSQLTNIQVQVGDSANCVIGTTLGPAPAQGNPSNCAFNSVAAGPVMSTGNAYTINTGISYPIHTVGTPPLSDVEVTVTFQILYGLPTTIAIGNSSVSTGTLYQVEVDPPADQP